MSDLYKNLFMLAYDHKLDMNYIENLIVWEYDIFMMMLRERLEEERAKLLEKAMNNAWRNSE